MIFNNKTDRPASYANVNSNLNQSPNIVRLIEDSNVEKTIRFDEMSLPDVPDPSDNTQGGNKKLSEWGLTFPMIRINDVILARKNITSMDISMSGFIPTIRLNIINDNTAFISKNMPKDGDIISVFIRTSTAALSYLRDDFIITSCYVNKGNTGNAQNSVYLTGKLFIPAFDSRTTTDGITGTSKDVMRTLAEIHGIGFSFNDFDDTNDFQTWIRCKETAEDFANDVTMHAWKDEFSFFRSWIDLYYDLCYVNVNKFLLSDQNDEEVDLTFATNILDMYNEVNNDSSVGNAKMAIKILSNTQEFRQSPFYIQNWTPVNMSSSVSLSNGYSTTTYSYIHNQNVINNFDSDCFETLNNIPAYDQNKTDSYILLRGRSHYDPEENPDDEQARVNYDFVNTYNSVVWTGIEYVMGDNDKNMDQNKWSGNVHKNFNRAPYHNSQNIAELNKMYLKVTCEGLNLQIMKGERIPVLLIFDNTIDNMIYNASTEHDQERSVNKFYSGYYIVDSIEYHYNVNKRDRISPYTTDYILKRREWPTPEAIAKEN